MKTKDFKNTKGITLISLVILIVVLLILAGVSIVTLTGGDNGLLIQAQKAKESTEVAKFRDAVQLAYMTAYSENAKKWNIYSKYGRCARQDSYRLSRI